MTFLGGLKDTFFPTKLPPLDVTSRPVQVKEMFGRAEYQSRSQLMSVGIHVGMVVLAFRPGNEQNGSKGCEGLRGACCARLRAVHAGCRSQEADDGWRRRRRRQQPIAAQQGQTAAGEPEAVHAAAGGVEQPNPRLAMEPTIIAPPDANLPQVNMPNFGDPLAKLGPPSNGPGSGGGIGTGSGGGVGSGRGGGFGPGEGGGFGGGAFRIGGGVSAPVPIFKVEPEYSEEARKAKFQGTVLLAIVVDEGGKTANVRVVRPLGMGLDEKAIEAVMKWRFRPGYKDGKAVPVMANVEVNFRLL